MSNHRCRAARRARFAHGFRGAAGPLTALLALAIAPRAEARDLISADGPGGTYELLGKSYGLETPDCGHMVPHITEEQDAELNRPVFVFHAHVNQDDDRCGKTDRQRTELRGRSAGVEGKEGTTVYYRWKFRLPPGFKASGAFTHIFQIKAYGNGHGSGAPIMTLTPRGDTFAIDGRIGKFGSTSLGKFIGTWVVVDLKILHSNAGRVETTIRRLSNGEMFFSHAGNADMWDDGALYGMPKFGIYRSLNDRGALRDEQVKFADFCVSQTSASECADGNLPPPAPADGGVAPDDAGGVIPDAGGGMGGKDGGTSPAPDGASASPGRMDAAAVKPPSKPVTAPDASTPPEDPGSGGEETPPARNKAAGGCTVGGSAQVGPGLLLVLGATLVARPRRRRRR